MKQAKRLFQLYLELESGKTVTAAQLAGATESSVRTVYRDMQRLVAVGLPVRGAPRTGYRMIEPVDLPPLLLSVEEMRALVAGAMSVKASSDATLKSAAGALLEKVSALVPARSRTKYGLKA